MSGLRLLHFTLWLVVFGYALFVGAKITDGYRDAAHGDTPLFTDFTVSMTGNSGVLFIGAGLFTGTSAGPRVPPFNAPSRV